MIVVADANLLLRFLARDDEDQFIAASRLFQKCKLIIIPTYALCEAIWNLSRAYKFKPDAILQKLEEFLKSEKILISEKEVEAGLDFLRRGGDFNDGVIAYIGRTMAGGQPVTFASFDRKAVRLLNEQGIAALIPK